MTQPEKEEEKEEYIHYKPSQYDKMIAQDRWLTEWRKTHPNYNTEADEDFYDRLAVQKGKRKKEQKKADIKEYDDKVRCFIVKKEEPIDPLYEHPKLFVGKKKKKHRRKKTVVKEELDVVNI